MQVNVATRDAALAPGGMDSMAFFEGSYTLQPLSSKSFMKPVEVLISTTNGELMRCALMSPSSTLCASLLHAPSPPWGSVSSALPSGRRLHTPQALQEGHLDEESQACTARRAHSIAICMQSCPSGWLCCAERLELDGQAIIAIP